MSQYRHYVTAVFVTRSEAEETLSNLVDRGMPRQQLQIFDADSKAAPPVEETRSDAVLKDVLVDGAIGGAVGTGLGALSTVALAAANVTLFIASPLVAPMMLLGWGASLGAFIGAAVGTTPGEGHKHGRLADLIGDVIAKGHVVLVAETRTDQESMLAKQVIQAAVGDDTAIKETPA
jgi:hypothetical protein